MVNQGFHEAERMAQVEEGRRTLRLKKPGSGGKKPASTPKGHEAYLKALEASGAQVHFTLMGGEKLIGSIKHSDKYTVSIHEQGEITATVVFKHDISRFRMIVDSTQFNVVTH